MRRGISRVTAGMLTTPNLCSLFRLLVSPILLLLAWGEEPTLFLVAFATALASDVVDGFLARWLKVDSEGGAELDSWSDLCMYVSASLGVWLLAPELILGQLPLVVAMAVGYAAPILYGFLKFRRLTSYHTWAAKLSAVLAGGTMLTIVLFEVTWPLWIAGPVFLVSAVEEICVTTLLPAWRANVPSFWHAVRIRRAWRQPPVQAPSPSS